MRTALALWCLSIAVLVATWTPGWDRAGAVVPLLAVCGFWALLAPHSGSHTDRAGLGLTSPAPSPAGSMQLDDDEEWKQARAGNGHVYGMTSGAGAPPWPGTEVWPGHEDPDYLPDPTAGADPGLPAVADPAGLGGEVSSLAPGPAGPPPGPEWVEVQVPVIPPPGAPWQPTRLADTG